MASLIHCYNVVIAAPRRFLAYRPRPLHHWAAKRTARRATAGKAAATGATAKTIIVCTVTSAGLGGLGYGGYRALTGNGPALAPAVGGPAGGSISGPAPFPFEFDTANLLGDVSKFVTPEISTRNETIIQTQPTNETTATVPEPSSAWLLLPALLLLGMVQWRMNRGKKSAG